MIKGDFHRFISAKRVGSFGRHSENEGLAACQAKG